MTIRLIENPPYDVYLGRLPDSPKEELPLSIRVRDAALSALSAVKDFFVSLTQATYITLSYSGVSFKHIVLGYYGNLRNFRPPADIYLAVFRLAFWILGLGITVTTTTCRLFIEKIRGVDEEGGGQAYVQTFAGNEIDASHLKTSDESIDTSDVPETVNVGQLASIFDEINFTNPNQPGYMAPSSRQEGTSQYSVEELKLSLNTFIKNVSQRIAFLGTPPQLDTPRLMAFYQQIEDATRVSIHKVVNDLANFRAENPQDPSTYAGETLRKYKDLLEQKARLAIDLSIAGKHCGTRYMGDSMTSYFHLKAEKSMERGTLADCLYGTLAKKRIEIAQSEIEQHLGNDTHSTANYMQTMGKPLALPGTKNIIESLSYPLNRDKYLRLFFKKYTADFIISSIQEGLIDQKKLDANGQPVLDKKGKEIFLYKGQPFREKIIDWMQTQTKTWKKEIYDKEIDDCITRTRACVNALMVEKRENIPTANCLQAFLKLIAHLRKVAETNSQEEETQNEIKKIRELLARFQEVKNFSEFTITVEEEIVENGQNRIVKKSYPTHFVTEIFSLEISKNHLKSLGLASPLERMHTKNLCMNAFFEKDLINEIWQLNKGLAPQTDLIRKKAILFENAAKLKKNLPVDDAVLLRLAEKITPLEENNPQMLKDFITVIKGYYEGKRAAEFSSLLKIEEMATKGLSPELMEWVLVSHNVLLPQTAGDE